jgi:hypothetical protein
MLKDMLSEGFDYWFADHEQVRSPFPAYMHEELKVKTSQKYSEWLTTIGEEEASQMAESEMVEMFEMFLFNVGLSLCSDPDQQITITYPFLPRCGDEVNDTNHGLSRVISRELIDNDDNKQQLRVFMETQSDRNPWQTEFDLKS